jgi:Fe-S cluster assembly protein SufD
MIETMSEKDTYLAHQAQFEKERGNRDPDWLRHVREAATERFAELGFPTTRHEDWKFTNARLRILQNRRMPIACSHMAACPARRCCA